MKLRVLKIEMPTFTDPDGGLRDVYVEFDSGTRVGLRMQRVEIDSMLHVGGWYDVRLEPTSAPEKA